MAKKSAGILLYRRRSGGVEVFLVHPGGPFWAKKDAAAWSIPKGEFDDAEEPLAAARREFVEETGLPLPPAKAHALQPVKQSNKEVHAWAIEGDVDPSLLRSNTFELEWPPRSGRVRAFPEVDKAGWFSLAEAAIKLHKGQVSLIAQLADILDQKPGKTRT